MKNSKMFGLILLFITYSAAAAPLVLKTERGQILVNELDGWELGRDMFGMPFIYFSPQKNGQRSNISFTATGVDVEFNLAEFGKDSTGYQKIKKEWSSKVGATPQSYHPYKSWKNSHGHNIHEVGFNYQHEGKNYTEYSYYADCRGRLIFAKSLRLQKNEEHQKEFHQLIKEMDCSL